MEAMHRRSASTYTFNGDSFVEFLTGPSPLDIVNGEKRYTVSDPQPKRKKKEDDNNGEMVGPVLGENPSCGQRIQLLFYNFAKSSLFEFFIIFCIMVNTVIMASEHATMSDTQIEVSTNANYVSSSHFFTVLFYYLTQWSC